MDGVPEEIAKQGGGGPHAMNYGFKKKSLLLTAFK